MTSGGRSPSALVPVPCRSVTRTTAGRSASAPSCRASSGVDDGRRRPRRSRTAGRSAGRGSPSRRRRRRRPVPRRGPALRPRERWRRVRAPRSAARAQDLAVGADDQDVVEPVDGQGGHHGPCQEPLDEVVPLLGVERLAEPRLGALERADRDDRRDPGHGGPAASRRDREVEDGPGEPGTAVVVGHDRVGHERPQPERRDRRARGRRRPCRGRTPSAMPRVDAGPLPGRSIRDRARRASGRPAP